MRQRESLDLIAWIGRHGLRDTEVQHFDEPFRRQHHVARLEVAVRYVVRMRFHERRSDLAADLERTPARDRSRRSCDNNVSPRTYSITMNGTLLETDVIDGYDVGMIQRGRCAGFVLEASATIGVAGECGLQDLDRDVTIQPRVSREVHHTHTAETQQRTDP